MRITRAAKVAAFPLTALILVALIACQGPAGPAGAAGGKGDIGAQGPAGKDALPPLASVLIDTVYFALPQAAGTEDDPVPTNDVDVSEGFTGGTAEGRTYKLGAVANSGQFTGFSYELDGSTLKLKMDEQEVPAGTDLIEDITIPIQAADTNGAVATTTVIVRGNVVPVVASATTDIELTVGLQAAATADGTDEDMDPDDYDGQTVTDGDITCVMLNACAVDLTGVTDRNRDDTVLWKFHNTDEDSIRVEENDGKGVMITGLRVADAAVSVYVWAEDAGGLPMLLEEDDETTTEIDESKWPAGARELMVTIDPPPSLGDGLTINGQMVTLPAQTLKSDPTETRVLGTVFDNETITLTPTGGSHPRIVSIALDSDDSTFTDGVLIEATPQNLTASRRTFTFKLSEPDTADTNNPQQFLEVSVDITVSND